MAVTPEGTLTFTARHAHHDWWSNAHGYDFGTVETGGLTAHGVKHPDGKFAVTIEGLPSGSLRFLQPTPMCDSQGLVVVVTWRRERVTLYFNGSEVDHFDVPVH